MEGVNDEILDYKDDPSPKFGLINILFTIAIISLAYWFVADEMGWAFSSLALLAGLLILAVIIIIRFILKSKHAPYEIVYLIGKLVLIVGIFISFMDFPYRNYYIIAAAVLFLLGMILPNND